MKKPQKYNSVSSCEHSAPIKLPMIPEMFNTCFLNTKNDDDDDDDDHS